MSDDRKFDTGQFVSLRDFLSLNLKPLENEVNDLKSAIEKLSVRQVSADNFDQIRLQVASLSEGLHDLEVEMRKQDADIRKLEQYHHIGMWGFRVVMSIATALIIGYLSGLIG